MHRPSHRSLASLGAAVLLGAGAGAGSYAVVHDGSSPDATATRTVTAQVAQTTSAAAGTLSVNEIYRQANPGVVEITATESGSTTPFGGGRGQAQAQGSGFVYDARGHVITNQHVVDGASSLKVQFADGSSYPATVVGSDPSTDVAVVKVDAPAAKLHPLALGDSSKVEVGDGVVAIGSPFGLEGTVTAGIVSALHRQIQAPNQFTINDAIQTDAAINHGNSGGPLLDMSGKVIGVNSQIDSESGGNDGVGFAVPSNTVRSIASKIISGGAVEHAYLGVRIGDGNGGALIGEVQPGTPADRAGLKANDLVTKVDGTGIGSSADLQSAIDAHAPGDKVTLTVKRGGSTKTVTVTLGTRPTSSS